MERVQDLKKEIRKYIREAKAKFTKQELARMSSCVISGLEAHANFIEAKNIFVYNSMPDEVSTTEFIQRWSEKKNIFLPVVLEDDLVLRKYTSESSLELSDYGILEPQGADFTDYKSIDLVVVPGVAFDRQKHRLGRGKGYYDRILPQMPQAVKIAICFEFQIVDQIPVWENDIDMDYIISEKGMF